MSEQKRQHPFMILLGALNSVIYLLFPLGILLVQNIFDNGLGDVAGSLIMFIATITAFLIFFLLFHTLKWAFYTYRYEEGYLHIKTGIIFKKERSIKQERVQTVNIRTGILQRLLGLASLKVETAGGGTESELSLTAVKMEEAYRIKNSLEDPDSGLTPYYNGVRTEEGEVYRISFLELFLAGATSGRFLVLFSLIAAAFSQLYPYVPEAFWEYLLEQVTSTATATVLLVTAFLLLLSWGVSTLAFMVQYANFTLHRQQDQLQVSWGLIEQKQLTVSLHRLQALSIQEGVLRQPLGRCAIIAEVAGGSSRDQDYITLLFPLLSTGELSKFLSRILPEYRLPHTWKSLPVRSCRRYLFRALALTMLVVLPLQWFSLPYGWTAFLLLIPAFFLGLSRYHAAGTSIDDGQVSFSFRNFNRYRVIMLRNHVQALQVSSNPFQRMRGLRSIRAFVLSLPAGKEFQVTDLDFQEAQRLWKWYSWYGNS